MSYYEFQPDLCFVARCYWQSGSHQFQPQDLDKDTDWLKPLWTKFNDTTTWDVNDGWLFAGRHRLRSVAERVVGDKLEVDHFWFGVYRTGNAYDYEIHTAYVGENEDKWPHLERRLDVSRNGYLGFYHTGVPAGEDPLVNQTMIWRLEGFDPAIVAVGDLISNVGLVSLHGKRVSRLFEDNRSYLSTDGGEAAEEGRIILQITHLPAPPHPRPRRD
ncbi:MAG TPA: hypothetical protein VJS90_21655 [Pseudomonas sp.]|uniref:hypothetical protein n=1 Tax=Pseudomonas sp. TaxID=306 RepID=UPI002B4901F5|nr:hypothetical protein [Pseudomonas sp.]HKS15640.1 hypothetical protein [Pseudomonas sp.]